MRLKWAILLMIGCLFRYTPGICQSSKSKKEIQKSVREHLKFEEWEQALPSLRELVEIDPGSAYYNYWLGRALYETYRKNQSLDYLEKANEIDPNVDQEFHYFYAHSLHYNLKFDAAIEEYKQELQRHAPATVEYQYIKNRIDQCEYAKKMVERKDSKRVKVTNMGPNINTEFSEHSPVVSVNDSILLLTARRPESLGAQPEKYYYDEDIYISYNKGGEWTKAENIGTPVNSKGHDATIALTAKGDKIYIYRHIKDGGIYESDFDTLGKKWKEPKNLGPPFNSKYYEACIYESADGELKFFTSNRPGGIGGKDIYLVRELEKGKWSEPENLGKVVNSAFDEDAPYLQAGGKVLYFSSNGPNSMGGYDIFVSEFDSNGKTWLKPLNMGPPVNTPDDDIYFVMDASGKNGYYASGKEGGYGEKDIYHIEFPYFPYPRRYFIIEFTGLVQDAKNLKEIPAHVTLRNKLNGEPVDSFFVGVDSSHFYFVLSPEGEYEVEINADKYKKKKDLVTIPRLEGDDILIERNYMLEREEVPADKLNAPVEIMNVYFDFDKYLLRDESVEELERALAFLRANPSLKLELRGHTDWFGTYDYNVKLSENRSNTVYNYLVKNGVDPSRLIRSYFSENMPIETNQNDDGRQFNRRTELLFYIGDQVAMESKKLRKGIYEIRVDHAMPKGKPGFDNPSGMPTGFKGNVPAYPVSSSLADSLKAPLEPGGIKTGNLANNANAEGNQANETYNPAGMKIRNIYFDFDKFNLRNESVQELNKIAAILAAHPDYRLEVLGHTDWDGSVVYNQKLSENRCSAALRYIQSRVANTVETKGFSELQPLDTNGTVSGRQNNRRVEFRIYKGDELLIQSAP